MDLGCEDGVQVVPASTLLGEPFALEMPQEIGAPMRFEPHQTPRPPPWGQATRVSHTWLQDLAASEDFPPRLLTQLAQASLESSDAVLALVRQWQQQGHDLPAIYLHAITPCARGLGQGWCLDELDFAQVTLGSAHLHRALHLLSEEFCAPGLRQPKGLSVLLATEPQAQHTMGAFMLGEFFRREGWRVQSLTPHECDDVRVQLARDWFDAVGLSISTTRHLTALQGLIPQLRAESPNPGLRVMAGGPMAWQHSESLLGLGVDLLGGAADETVRQLSQMTLTQKS